MFNKVKESRKNPKDAVCLLEVTGKTIDVIITHVKDQRIKVNGKARPLPNKPYYITSSEILENMDLNRPIRTYIMDRDVPKNLEIVNKNNPDALIPKNLKIINSKYPGKVPKEYDIINVDFQNIDKNLDGTEKETLYTNDTMDLLLNDNIFVSMFRGLSLNKFQIALYMCLGVVVYNFIKGFISLMILFFKG